MASTTRPLSHVSSSTKNQDPEKGLEKSNNEIKTVRIERDMQEVTVEGYRTLGVVSTFIAGVEAQCFSLIPDATSSEDNMVQAIGALLIIGLLLSSFGAVTALLAARWFDLLKGEEVELLNHRWACARAGFSGPSPKLNAQELALDVQFEYTEDGNLPSMSIRDKIAACEHTVRNRIVAKVIFIPFYLILFGFYSFVVGIIIYTWKFQALVTAIVCTGIVVLGCLVVICLHLNFETLGALNMMSFRRLRL